LKGRVINLATGQSESGMIVRFSTGGISVEVSSDANGEYAFEHLGTADGVLNVVPLSESGVKPVTTDVWVRTRTGIETVVNLGVASGTDTAPPIRPEVDIAPSSASAGDLVTIKVLVENSSPNTITDATVTNLLPSKVIPVSIHSSTGNPYFSGNLAIAELGRLDAASSALVEIVAEVASGRISASALQGSASVFYREDIAAQPQVGGNANSLPTVLPVTGVGLPLLGLGLVVVVVLVGWIRRRVGRATLAD
jgi:uncharacterized repeat protein (TIGR01451 family)